MQNRGLNILVAFISLVIFSSAVFPSQSDVYFLIDDGLYKNYDQLVPLARELSLKDRTLLYDMKKKELIYAVLMNATLGHGSGFFYANDYLDGAIQLSIDLAADGFLVAGWTYAFLGFFSIFFAPFISTENDYGAFLSKIHDGFDFSFKAALGCIMISRAFGAVFPFFTVTGYNAKLGSLLLGNQSAFALQPYFLAEGKNQKMGIAATMRF